jgi:formylmethanofuran dehydrogenase subunit E
MTNLDEELEEEKFGKRDSDYLKTNKISLRPEKVQDFIKELESLRKAIIGNPVFENYLISCSFCGEDYSDVMSTLTNGMCPCCAGGYYYGTKSISKRRYNAPYNESKKKA